MFKYQTIVILLVVLGAATCFIAYLSDQLGMKLGKKRISLKIGRFSLRPRQTATVLSMASSLAVMLVTMLALLAINPSLRQGLLYYDEARRENARLGSLNADLKTTSQQQRTAISTQSARNQTLADSLQKRNFQLLKLNREVGQKQLQFNNAQLNLDLARRNLQGARRNLQSAQRERKAARRESENARRQSQLALRARDVAQSAQQRAQTGEQQARARFQTAQTRLQKAIAQEAAAQKNFLATQANLSSTRSDLESAQRARDAAKAETETAKNQTRSAQRQTVATYRSNAIATAQLNVTKVQLAALQTQLITIQRQRDKATGQLRFAGGLLSGETKHSVTAGQLLGDATIPAATSAAQARTILVDLLQNVRETTKSKGFETLRLVPSTVQQDGKTVELNEEESLSLTALVASQSAPISMRVLAARDHATVETQLLVRMQGVLVRPAFADGETLAQTTIRGGQDSAESDVQVFNRLLSLLDEGQKRIAERVVSPIPTPSEPNVYASDTRLVVFQAMRKIRAQSGQSQSGEVAVRLVTASALSTLDPVRIRLEVGAEIGAARATENDKPNDTSTPKSSPSSSQ